MEGGPPRAGAPFSLVVGTGKEKVCITEGEVHER
jgi:hypothetical protein